VVLFRARVQRETMEREGWEERSCRHLERGKLENL
jgi:hypothetical protein